MSDKLIEICDVKRGHVAECRVARPLGEIEAVLPTLPPTRGFIRALRAEAEAGRPGLIAEIKRASPSKGLIRAFFDPPALAQAYAAGEDTTRQATVAKLMSGRLVREVADACVQFHGGMGYMEETWTARFFRDSRLLSIGGGADEVMLQVLAKLDGFDA